MRTTHKNQYFRFELEYKDIEIRDGEGHVIFTLSEPFVLYVQEVTWYDRLKDRISQIVRRRTI